MIGAYGPHNLGGSATEVAWGSPQKMGLRHTRDDVATPQLGPNGPIFGKGGQNTWYLIPEPKLPEPRPEPELLDHNFG
jgi:hypothetical protein